MIAPMTDPGGLREGAAACPFVAFEADRDRRATVPDERHRCYAEATPAPRAIGHQETFCLTPNFAGCPTFVDWAKRQAARAVPAPGARTGFAGSTVAAVAAAEAGETGMLETALEQGPPPRDPSAPPPWLSETPSCQLAFAATDDASVESGVSLAHEDETHDLGRERMPLGDPRAGEPARPTDEERPGRLGVGAGAAAIAALGGADAATRGSRVPVDDDVAPPAFLADRARAQDEGPHGVTRFSDRNPAREQARPAEPVRPRRGEPPRDGRRRPEAYPRRRGISIPPVLIGLVALLIAAALLFVLPSLFTNPPQFGGASDSPQASPTEAASPTAPPSPTPQQYTVAEGDTMSGIAAQFDVTVTELIAANPQIPDPDRLAIGDVLTIPPPGGVPGSASPSASAAASSPLP